MTKQAFLPRNDHRRSIIICRIIIIIVGVGIHLRATGTPLGEIGTDVSVERDPQVSVPVVLDPVKPVLVPGVHGTHQGGPDRLTLADPPVNDGGDPRPPGSKQCH